MIYINCKHFPPKGYKAISLFGIVIHRSDTGEMDQSDFQHEEIHALQQSDTQTAALIIASIMCTFFPSIWWFVGAMLLHLVLYGLLSVIYGIVWWIKLGSYKEMITDELYYYKNPLEMEAYTKEDDITYLAKRHPFAWVKYLRQ